MVSRAFTIQSPRHQHSDDACAPKNYPNTMRSAILDRFFMGLNRMRAGNLWSVSASTCFVPRSARFSVPRFLCNMTTWSVMNCCAHKVCVSMCLILPAPLRDKISLDVVLSTNRRGLRSRTKVQHHVQIANQCAHWLDCCIEFSFFAW